MIKWIKTHLTAPQAVIIAIVLIIVYYSLFELRFLLRGPVLEIFEPQNGAVVTDSYLEIKGKAKRISKIYLNDRKIYINKENLFSESLLLSSGYNIIILKAEDKFGRKIERKVEVVLK